MTRLRRAVAWAALGLLTAALTACSTPEGPRPLTEEEADRVAETLFTNWSLGGAEFSLSARSFSGGTVTLTGRVDFREHVGRADVLWAGEEPSVTEVAWTSAVVIERRPAFTELARSVGAGDFDFVARPADAGLNEVDSLLAVMVGLAAERRDNPLLVQQNPLNQWLRADELGGVPVDVFAVEERSRVWIEQGTSRMLRFESDNSTGTRPIVIDLVAHGEQPIEAPDPASVADALLHADLYRAAGGQL